MNKKNIAKLITLALTICILVFVSLSTKKTENSYAFLSEYSTEGLDLDYSVSNDNNDFTFEKTENMFTPKLGKTFTGFKEELGFKESQNNYFSVNTLGYLGKYQFGKSTLSVIGITDIKKFLNTPELQEKAFIANAERNKWVLRRDIKRFSGKYINGIKITESGILAAAHLAGPGSVKKYLRSYGAVGFSDAYGTSIRSYMKRFSGYDVSHIKPNKKPKVSLDA
ncbi:peptidoglycan-binding protein LysM [uncultured Lacinutrix sp.]|uniref:peptidoglycan-binding protein LysM n=1 Tax=uncultured Lacinutrix sp. TaxID=574032 RepID=UPI0026313055|nr:peptidoglycan-binding protein LysM [uncultured Lacinutrix sp.]